MRGSLSGQQALTYTPELIKGYAVASGTKETANDYQPILVAKVARFGTTKQLRFFQVRTRSSVHMTANYRRNCALMGGVGALFAGLVNDKNAQIYKDCVRVCPGKMSLRAFLSPILRAALAAKSASITVADGVVIVNPWISSATPNVPVAADVLDKFSSELSNS